MQKPAIEIHQISKRYHIGALKANEQRSLARQAATILYDPLKRSLALMRGQPLELSEQTMWALKDVSFNIDVGEVIGIIGRNGAGKSTLLKILARITTPTDGKIVLRGRVASLLEVGTGFHPQLTGRENIYMNGTILGMRAHEIRRKFDEIVEFAGVEQYIDTPVKHYSSGMRVRLGFAVAAYLEPEILLVDEVLAVGDLAFQKRSIGKMQDVASSGRTVLFVSHNMDTIMNLCPRSVLLDGGRVTYDGETSVAVEHYSTNLLRVNEGTEELGERTDRTGSGKLRFTTLECQRLDGSPLKSLASGDGMKVVLRYSATIPRLLHVSIRVSIMDIYGRVLSRLWTTLTDQDYDELPTQGKVSCVVPRLPLAPGRYLLTAGVYIAGELADNIFGAAQFDVIGNRFFDAERAAPLDHKGIFYIDHQWEAASQETATFTPKVSK